MTKGERERVRERRRKEKESIDMMKVSMCFANNLNVVVFHCVFFLSS